MKIRQSLLRAELCLPQAVLLARMLRRRLQQAQLESQLS